MKVAIVTATTLPQPDPDEPGLVRALTRRGATVTVLPWDEPAAPFAEADVAVIRSTWNYLRDRDGFCAWAARTAERTRLFNPAGVVRDNTDKRYLEDLERRGVPVVPSLFVSRTEPAEPALAACAARGWTDVVIKPSVSAGSFGTRRFGPDERDEAAAFLRQMLDERDMMLQPYQPSVETWGERSLVWIDGELTHATRKTRRFDGDPPNISEAVEIEGDERELAARALAGLEDQLLYARVDVARDERGEPRLMELELTEPYLMLDRFPAALERLADALIRVAAGGSILDRPA